MSQKRKIRVNKAPLVQPDILELGDHRLNEVESLAKLKEENRNKAQGSRLNKQDELEDTDRAGGSRMSSSELIRRLRKVNPQILSKDGTPGSVALYRPKTRAEMDSPDAWNPSALKWHNEHVYVGGFPVGDLQEFSTVSVDNWGRPQREQRGWRSIVIAMVKAGAISYDEAVKEFGERDDQRMWRWHYHLKDWKKESTKRFTRGDA